MRTTCVFLGMLIFSATTWAADSTCENLFSQEKKFEMSVTQGWNGDVNIVLPSLEIEGRCIASKRSVFIRQGQNIEITVVHFSDGTVLQYVVKLCGREVGFIKIIRGEGQYSQPRIVLTDPFDRELGNIANAENEEKQFTVRDEGKKIASGHRIDKGRWEITSDHLPPVLSGLLLAASRMERNSCEDVAAFNARITKAVAGTLTVLAVVTAALYLKFKR